MRRLDPWTETAPKPGSGGTAGTESGSAASWASGRDRPDAGGGFLATVAGMPLTSEAKEGRGESRPTGQILPPALGRAVQALRESGATFLVLRLPVPDQEPARDLDLLVSPGSLQDANRALRGAGFLPLT